MATVCPGRTAIDIGGGVLQQIVTGGPCFTVVGRGAAASLSSGVPDADTILTGGGSTGSGLRWLGHLR
jgi:hypothetical protein